MSKVKKNLFISFLSVMLCVCMSVAVVFLFTTQKHVVVSATNEENVFVIEKGAAARISENCGIQFTAYFDNAFYESIVSGDGNIKDGYTLGMIIVPSYFFIDYENYKNNLGYLGGYYEYFKTVKGQMIDLHFTSAEIRTNSKYGYCIKGAIVNMKTNNLDLEYSAIAYLNVNGNYRYTESSLPRTVRYIATKAIENGSIGAETLGELYGVEGYASYTVETYLQADSKDYVLASEYTQYLYGEIGSTIDLSSTAPVIDGYMLSAGESIMSGKVTNDGALTLKLYYTKAGGYYIEDHGDPWHHAKTISGNNEKVYNHEANSVALEFNNDPSLILNVESLNGTSGFDSGFITFKLKNETGIALDIYTDKSYEETGNVYALSASFNWQTITLPISNASEKDTIYLRSQGGSSNISEGKFVYISEIQKGGVETSGTYLDFSKSESLTVDSQVSGINSWDGAQSVSVSGEKTFNGKNTLKVDLSVNGYGAGIWYNAEYLRKLLGVSGVNSVTLKFHYNYTSLDGDKATFIGLAVGNEWDSSLINDGEWHEFSYKFTQMPQYAILHVSTNNGSNWSTTLINGIYGTLYVSSIEYVINETVEEVGEPYITPFLSGSWNEPAYCEKSTEQVYGKEADSYKLGFNAGYKYANIYINNPVGQGKTYEAVEFYIYNATGVTLEIFTDYAAWSGVQTISANPCWQKVVLYCTDPTQIAVNIRGAGETVVNGSEIKTYYVSNPKMLSSLPTEGTLLDYNANTSLVSGWTGASVESTSEKTFNGENTLKLKLSANNYADGVALSKVMLSKLGEKIGSNNVKSITLTFYYDASKVGGSLGYAIGLTSVPELDCLMNREPGWHKVSIELTQVPSDFILHISTQYGFTYDPWNVHQFTGCLYVSNVTYKLNYTDDIGVIEDNIDYYDGNTLVSLSSAEAATANTKQWVSVGFTSMWNQDDGNFVQVSGYDAGWGGIGFFLSDSATQFVADKLAQDNVAGVKLSLKYNIAWTGASYIGFVDATNSWNCPAIGPTGVWNDYEIILTSFDSHLLFGLWGAQNGTWTGVGVDSSTFNLTDIKYEVLYNEGTLVSFTTADKITKNTKAWSGNVGLSSYADASYGNIVKISGTNFAWGGFGFLLSDNINSFVANTLAKENVDGIKLSLKYYVEQANTNVSYIGFVDGGHLNCSQISAYDCWCDLEQTITSFNGNILLGVWENSAGTWTGHWVGAVYYLQDVNYEIIYKTESNITSTFEKTDKVFYGTEGYSTKVSIAKMAKATELNVNLNTTVSTGVIEFKVLNKTGKAFNIYTDANEWSGKVRVAPVNSWQVVRLYAPTTATNLTLYIETADGRIFNPTLISNLYVSKMFIGEANVVEDLNSLKLIDNGVSNFEIVYSNNASDAEINDANRLKTFIESSTGNQVEVKKYLNRTTTKHFIAIGNDFPETVPYSSDTDDSYRIIKSNGNVFIYGMADRGTSYAILDFAEKYFGYSYVEADCWTTTPVSDLLYSVIEEVEFTPTVALRAYLGFDTKTAKFNGQLIHGMNQELSYNDRQNTDFVEGVWATDYNWAGYSGATEGIGYHGLITHNTVETMTKGVNLYNTKHGTSLNVNDFLNGDNDHLDICFTKTVNGVSSADLVALAMEDLIEKNYANGTKYYTFEKEDYKNSICQCANCRAAANTLKGASGLNVWFVNKVIDIIDNDGYADYDYKISIFAYYDTEDAPTAIATLDGFSNKACDKLIIKFAFIENDYHYGIYDERANSKAILDAWENFIGKETAFWLYDADFSYYPGYFPVLNCIADNVYAIKKFNASFVIINDSYDAPHDWDAKLRRYIYSKMLWNFDEAEYLKGDANSNGVNDYVERLAKTYLNQYYGAGNGELIWNIIQCYESSSANKTVKSSGKSTYNLGENFYRDRFGDIMFGNRSTTGVLYTTDPTMLLRIKEVALSIVADLKYIGGWTSYNNSDIQDYFGTKNLKDIFLSLCSDVGFTQWSEDYLNKGINKVEDMA